MTPIDFGLVGLDRARDEAGRIRDLDEVGEVILVLQVVRFDRLQHRQGLRAAKADRTRVAQPGRFLFGGRVLVLADRDEPAVTLDEPAVARWIGRSEAERHEPRTLGEDRAHRGKRRSPQERNVGIGHQNLVVPARDRLACGENRVGGAAPFSLDEHARAGRRLDRLGRDVVPPRPDDDGDVACARLPYRREDMREHRPASNLVEHFRAIRPHPLAFAGGENDRE